VSDALNAFSNAIASLISAHVTFAALLTAFHLLVAVSSAIAILVLIMAARAFSARADAAAAAAREADRREEEDRVRVLARAGLSSSGYHLPPDDDPLWLAGRRASEIAKRRNRRNRG
jgi:hypothetical protein